MPNSLTINGAGILRDFLKAKQATTIFAITGAGNLAIIDALEQDSSFKIVYSHHEQAAVMEAQGFSRVTGNPGVALVTTGGGTSNAFTGVLSANLDSIPVFVITGNESSFHCETMHHMRAYGVQGFDSVASFTPITKSSQRIKSVGTALTQLEIGWAEMISGRPGACHVDFPMDLQRKFLSTSELSAGYEPESDSSVPPNTSDISTIVEKLSSAKKPLLIIGNGVRIAGGEKYLQELLSKITLPVVTSWSAIDLLEESNPLNLGRVGIYGDRHANIALQKADFVMSIGSRLAIPQVGYDVKDFGRKAEKWVIDIDQRELEKFAGLGWGLSKLDASFALQQLSDQILVSDESESARQAWLEVCMDLKAKLPRSEQVGARAIGSGNIVHSYDVISSLNESLATDALIVTDVGAALLHGHYGLEIRGNQRLFSSQGLGEMGFGLPAAIGAHFGDPSRQIICLNTDGAMMFNLQELQVASHHNIPLKLFVFNNDGYSMIKISQDNLFDGRKNGSTPDSGVSIPSFQKIAELFNFAFKRVDSTETMDSDIRDALATPGPSLVEIVMAPEQRYLPRLSTAKLEDGTLVSPPIEDLDPLISIELLEELLGSKAHPSSYRARNLKIDA
jgi:acetolactate synthase-1/2/3 large subunit